MPNLDQPHAPQDAPLAAEAPEPVEDPAVEELPLEPPVPVESLSGGSAEQSVETNAPSPEEEPAFVPPLLDQARDPNAPINEEAQPEQKVLDTQAAFICYQDADGHWVATGELNWAIRAQRPAVAADFLHAAVDMHVDISASNAAQATVITLQQQAMAMANAQAAAEAAKRAGIPGGGVDLSGFRR